MIEKRLVQRSGYNGRSITLIAVGRMNCQAGQDRAQEPCDNVDSRCDGTIHAVPNDKDSAGQITSSSVRGAFAGNSHGCCSRLCRDPVAVAWGLAGDEDADKGCASVDSLMVLAGGDFEAFTGVKDEVVMLYLKRELSFEHVEELACARMMVA